MYDRKQIMQRAWEIFRKTYDFPAIPFNRIGRHCFAACLRRAWAEVKAARSIKPVAPDPQKIRERIWVLEGASLNMRVGDQISALREQLHAIEGEAA